MEKIMLKRKNIDYYKQLKGIRTDVELVKMIGMYFYKGEELIDDFIENFVDKNKGNFSKMFNGERQLSSQYIIPLEKILGVSIARLTDDDAYKLPVEKDNVPYDKGFRYYAFKDEMELYENEFDMWVSSDTYSQKSSQNHTLSENLNLKVVGKTKKKYITGASIINNTDEFGKTFLDYVLEYNAVNGVRYLCKTYGVKYEGVRPILYTYSRSMLCPSFSKFIPFARLVASMNDAKMFNEIFDTYRIFINMGFYTDSSIYTKEEYFEIICDNDHLFNSMFEERNYIANGDTYKLINPIINNVLRYALKNLDKYKDKAEKILKFGIEHNQKVLKDFSNLNGCIEKELGRLVKYGHSDINVVILVDVPINDNDLELLANKLMLPIKRRSLDKTLQY